MTTKKPYKNRKELEQFLRNMHNLLRRAKEWEKNQKKKEFEAKKEIKNILKDYEK